jgi:hypothetical protein
MTAFESVQNTMVIEVPAGKGMFTVAGPLASEALFKEGGQCAGLTDSVGGGDQVTVKWRGTDKGQMIEVPEGD